MLMFLWMCVMTQAMFPGAERAMILNRAGIEARLRASLEEPYEVPQEARRPGVRRSVAQLEHYKTPTARSV